MTFPLASHPETSLFELERQAFETLQQRVRDRSAAEAALNQAHLEAVELADREVQKARRTVAAARKRAQDEVDQQRLLESEATKAKLDEEEAQIEAAYKEARAKAEHQYRLMEAKLKNDHKERLWTIDSLHEASEKETTIERDANARHVQESQEHIEHVWETAEPHLTPFGLSREKVKFRPERLPPALATDPIGKLEKSLEDLDLAHEKLIDCTLPKFVGLWGTVWCVFVAGGLAAALGAVFGLQLSTLLLVAILGAILGGLLLRQGLWFLARRQIRDRGSALGVFSSEAERALVKLDHYVQQRYKDRIAESTRQHEQQRKQADDMYLPKLSQVSRQARDHLSKIDNERSTKLAAVAAARLKAEREQRMLYANKNRDLAEQFDAQLQEHEQRYTQKCAEADAARQTAWDSTAKAWFDGLESVRQTCTDLKQTCAASFPNWACAASGERPLTTAVPLGIPFGEYAVDVLKLPAGTPADARLLPAVPLDLQVPAFLPFPDRAAVLLQARDEGRPATVAALQAAMLRFLTGLPPGKVRFTIIDPVGLGENFAAFMHLADFDEQLVTSRIWTEPQHIEKRLLDLTEHMENVIQKYLRNQYRSIEQYNRAAGEVAEPYRVLVVANFPMNFTPEAARRLISIMSSGPACGVCTLVGVDRAAALPRDFRLADLEQVAFNLNWHAGTFHPTDPAFTPFPLTVDQPPDPTQIAAIVQRVGEASRSAKRVEVPFSYIAPSADKIWAGSTKNGFEIPIGRAGATRRQLMVLGQGTAQHALIAGKTGSGKSTLLHAIITNLALTYSPDEAELYLIDFKKGVEFKMYAACQLPHARVVAIESEREFGISVLSRLDGILRERGEQYRLAGANDVASYRDARPDERFPRILLVVDEFQEFFVEDDKIAQEAGLLLDRLVRQGRAFGVHILLGSQTLGGAYSIPRTTIDQMAVRVALQCSDADAQLILSKDNSAARLLSRPGDAIYNDANGLVEGNDPFQVVWLPEAEREEILLGLRDRAAGTARSLLVFEGSASADIAACAGLRALVELPVAALAPAGPPTIWLGDAVAIKDPTQVQFRPQSGSHLLMLGQHEEAALGLQVAALAALSVRLQKTSRDPAIRTIAVIDGTPDDAETADVLRQTCAALDLPRAIVERIELPAALAEFAQELDRRQKGEADRSPRFLIVQGLQRLRELRKPDDDFGYGRRGEKTETPGSQFMALLKDGAAFGLHVIVWCDSVANLTRALDRPLLREFGLRVLFQMSPTDSSQLIDSPAASKLGRTRALFIEEGLERPEKFRPYGLPGLEWLKGLARRGAGAPAPDSP